MSINYLVISLLLLFFSGGCNQDFNIKHQVYMIEDFENADYLVPDATGMEANCTKLTASVIKFQKDLMPHRDLSLLPSQCESAKMSCEDLGLKGFISNREGWGNLRAPLFTLEQWSELFPTVPIMINSTFFEIEKFPNWPHNMPCTNIFGFAKASNGKIIGNSSPNYPFDYFVVEKLINGLSRINLIFNDELTEDISSQASSVINGLLLVKDSAYVYKPKTPLNNPKFSNVSACGGKHGRTLIGIRRNDLLIFHLPNIEKETAATCYEVAQLARVQYGVSELFLFDGGGSAGLLIKNTDNGTISVKTVPSDSQGSRPIPSVLGITPHSLKQFSIVRGP